MRILALVSSGFLLAAFVAVAVPQPPPGGAGKGKGKEKERREPRVRPDALMVDLAEPPAGWVKNPRFVDAGTDPKLPAHFVLKGDAAWRRCGTADEFTDLGIALPAGGPAKAGGVSQAVSGFPTGVGKWYRFSVRGLAEPGFAVDAKGSLALRVDFAGNKGTNPLDGISKELYPLVDRDRKELAANGRRGRNGGAVWKTYALDFRLPFAEIDTLTLGVAFQGGTAAVEKESEFYVTDFQLAAIPPPEDAPTVVKTAGGPAPSLKSLVSLGGRWYYAADPGMAERPATLVVNAKNADRLYYRDDRLTTPFAGTMTAWLRKGHLDLKGNAVTEDRFLPDNVVLEFKDGREMVVHTRGIPNHPTAVNPGRGRNGGTPNSIQEGDRTYYLPLEPTRNPNAVAMDKTNANRALPGGGIGFALNGVVFFNPFDADGEEAVDLMDRCCGHPSPGHQYHYHKYPVCAKTPFADDGGGHSPLIGFALDGFPVYGPYVAKGAMAKDAIENPLDAFNMRHDADRGWHYHATPGKYPYLIGGFAGAVDARNGRRGPPR